MQARVISLLTSYCHESAATIDMASVANKITPNPVRICDTSVREAEVQHVAVGDDILLTFETELAGILGPRFALQ